MHAGLARFSVTRDVARCRDDENISKLCVLKPGTVDLGCYNAMEFTPFPELFLPVVFSMQLSVD